MQATQTQHKGNGKTTIQERGQGMRGKITMSENVVATIAALAADDIEGINSVGKPRLISLSNSPHRGVEAEVGNTQAALDLDVVVDYGCDIQKMADSLRETIKKQVEKMAGRDVVEVNLNVVDIKLPEDETPKVEEAPRVS